jgi:thymidylate synthase
VDVIDEPTLSAAWLAATRLLAAESPHATHDLIVRITRPLEEDQRVRTEAERLARDWPIETSANTIFPRSYGFTGQSPERLAERYLIALPRIKHEQENRFGTYFLQLIAYPNPKGGPPVNQLAIAVRRARGDGQRLNNVYDMHIAIPGYNTRPRGFPCLAYLNFKIDGNRLLLTAHYRNHYFLARAYGNYLGLARLQAYLASQMRLRPGPLICISGHAVLDGPVGEVKAMLARLDA